MDQSWCFLSFQPHDFVIRLLFIIFTSSLFNDLELLEGKKNGCLAIYYIHQLSLDDSGLKLVALHDSYIYHAHKLHLATVPLVYFPLIFEDSVEHCTAIQLIDVFSPLALLICGLCNLKYFYEKVEYFWVKMVPEMMLLYLQTKKIWKILLKSFVDRGFLLLISEISVHFIFFLDWQ